MRTDKFAVAEERYRSAVCPICKKENKITDPEGSVIKVCKHFVKADEKCFYFDEEGKEGRR